MNGFKSPGVKYINLNVEEKLFNPSHLGDPDVGTFPTGTYRS